MSILAWKIRADRICSQHPSHQPATEDVWLEPVDTQQATSLDVLTQKMPGGAYTTLRTFGGSQVIHLEDHFSRLENTAALVSKPLFIARSRVRSAMLAALRISQLEDTPQAERNSSIEAPERSAEPYKAPLQLTADLVYQLNNLLTAPAKDFRFRLTLDLQENPGDFYLALQHLSVPAPVDYLIGVPVITHTMQRWLPKAKLTRFIQRSGAVRQSMPAGVNETIMVDEGGNLLEGLSSNFFAVMDGEIWTAEEGVLSGITRSMVLEGVKQLSLPLRLQPARLIDVPSFQEAFITSSSRAVLPVSKLDDFQLPAVPGPITAKLMDEYSRSVAASLEDIF